MRASNRGWLITLIALSAVAVGGCAHLDAPTSWQLPAAAAMTSPLGAWIQIEDTVGGRRRAVVQGELLAADDQALHVLTAAGYRSIPTTVAKRLTLTTYAPSSRRATTWALLGTLSTLSHGIYLIGTVPGWTLAGVAASRSETMAGVVHARDLAWRFARFPQGLPEGFDPASLGPLRAPSAIPH